MLLGLFGSKKVVGLDIGSSAIKMAELDVSGQSAKLSGFGVLPTPHSSYNNGDILNAAVLAETIRQILAEYKLARKAAAIGLAGTAVIVKKITMPRIDKKQLADQIRWEAEQYIPFDPSNISLDYHVIEGSSSPDTMEVLLVAAQSELVRSYAGVIQSAGLELKVLDVSGFALANTFEFNYGKSFGQTVGLLNIGASTTSLVVVHSGEVIFCRDMNVGGQNYTYEIHKELKLSLPEAEAMKLSALRGEGVPDEVHSVMSSVTESVKEEIRNSFDYFIGGANGLTLQQFFFSGGASSTPGLIESISQAVQVPSEPLNPFLRISPGKKLSPGLMDQVQSYASVAIGLALRQAGDS